MTKPITPERLAEIEARDKARTQGKWAWDSRGYKDADVQVGIAISENNEQIGGFVKETARVIYVDPIADTSLSPNPHENANFIASSSEDTPDMAAEIRRLWARERELLILMAAENDEITDDEAMEALGDEDFDDYYARIVAAREKGYEIVHPE